MRPSAGVSKPHPSTFFRPKPLPAPTLISPCDGSVNGVEKLSSLIAFIWLCTRCINIRWFLIQPAGEIAARIEQSVEPCSVGYEEIFQCTSLGKQWCKKLIFNKLKLKCPSPSASPLFSFSTHRPVFHALFHLRAATSASMMKRCLRQLLFGQSARNR